MPLLVLARQASLHLISAVLVRVTAARTGPLSGGSGSTSLTIVGPVGALSGGASGAAVVGAGPFGTAATGTRSTSGTVSLPGFSAVVILPMVDLVELDLILPPSTDLTALGDE